MPTVGWIRETIEDRYWESVGGGLQVAGPASFECPFCSSVFEASGARDEHVSLTHPIDLPVLFLNGRLAPSRLSIRTTAAARSVTFANCTGISAEKDGLRTAWHSVRQFVSDVAKQRRAFYELLLENKRSRDSARSTARYSVQVAVPSDASLNAIDKQFVRYLAVDDLNTTAIARFADKTSINSEGEDYADGLSSYALGVLTKDQAGGVTLPFERFKEKFSQALAVLADYDRPVARAVCVCARFNLNDFDRPHSSSGIDTLDAAVEFFTAMRTRQKIRANVPPMEGKGQQLSLCPIDRVTDEVLHTFALFRRHNLSKLFLEDLGTRIDSGTMSDYDRVKLRTIFAALCLRDGYATIAVNELRALQYDETVGAWAREQFEVV